MENRHADHRGVHNRVLGEPGAPAFSLELGREKPPQGAVHKENDNGHPRLRLRLQGGWRGDHI